ncbi:MAG: DUF222 domain-containing protein, partial [Propionibacteriaceae bacterium]|nr:DUF222 domain-containing protein [Propionibacteriaceae bacterium]
MYNSVEEWRAEARQPLEEWIELRQHMAVLEARSAGLLARAVDASRWPEELPLPERCDTLRAQAIQGGVFAEDLTSEIAVALKTSVGAAERLVGDILRLEDRLPRCWAKVVTGEAELWQARKIVDACTTVPLLGGESIPGIDVAGLLGTGGAGLPDTGAGAGAETGDGTGTGAEVEDGDEAGAETGDG